MLPQCIPCHIKTNFQHTYFLVTIFHKQETNSPISFDLYTQKALLQFTNKYLYIQTCNLLSASGRPIHPRSWNCVLSQFEVLSVTFSDCFLVQRSLPLSGSTSPELTSDCVPQESTSLQDVHAATINRYITNTFLKSTGCKQTAKNKP